MSGKVTTDVRLMKHKNGQHTVMVRSQSVRSMQNKMSIESILWTSISQPASQTQPIAGYSFTVPYSKGDIQLACIKGLKNRTFEAYISLKRLIRKCFQLCLILAYANLWRKKNIPPFYKLVATYKDCPKTTLILKRALGKVTKE